MRLIDRAKNICLSPKTEWDVIAAETAPPSDIVTGYVLPLAGIAAVAAFIGGSLVGYNMGFFGSYRMPVGWGIGYAVYQLVMAVVSVFVLGWIIDWLAPNFGGQKNYAQAFKIAAYSYTPSWIAGILMVVPMLGILVLLGALYGLYLLYLGLPRLMKNPPEKSGGYTAVIVICAIVLGVIIGAIGGLFVGPGMHPGGAPFDRGRPMSQLGDFGRKLDEASRKMDAAQKSGDPGKQMEAALQMVGTALSGGKGGEALGIEQLKPFVPDRLAGLPRTSFKSERNGVSGFMVASTEAVYRDTAGKRIDLSLTDAGGARGMLALASWAGVQGEREDEYGMERTRKDGGRLVHERVSKGGGANKFSVVLGERFLVEASGRGVDIDTLKGAVASLDLVKLESLKDAGAQK